jgi:putative transposase
MNETRYRRNAGAIYSLKYHLVWCPKYRRSVLTEPIAVRLKELLQEKAKELEIEIETFEIGPDHVHIFVNVDPTESPAHLVNQFKGFTSFQLRQEFPELKSKLPTLWSRNYFTGSVGFVSEETIEKYIENQKGK